MIGDPGVRYEKRGAKPHFYFYVKIRNLNEDLLFLKNGCMINIEVVRVLDYK